MPDSVKSEPNLSPPRILAPAGNKDSFLAALAAGADAVYCGLKRYSARMEAQNFSIPELASLTRLAHEKDCRVYVTVNTLVTPGEMDDVLDLLNRLLQSVHPDALILQDLAILQSARRIGFTGELILSTLANVSFSKALEMIRRDLGINRVVLPRELNIDEIRAMAAACPEDLALEVFVHGALCYAVSGRCYWSSYLGGKSGLRGRCVQPCRRMYQQLDTAQRRFSCQDLSVDVLTKVLLTIPQIRNWKIEGRKKGPHYVFYTVKAYQMLRDHGRDPKAKKDALSLLGRSLGRSGTHYNFLPQRPQSPFQSGGRTASGLFMGKTQGSGKRPYLSPREALFPGDLLRIGYEDSRGHGIQRIRQHVPKKGRYRLKFSAKDTPPRGTPVFLIDRREKALEAMLNHLARELTTPALLPAPVKMSRIKIKEYSVKGRSQKALVVFRSLEKRRSTGRIGLWIDSGIRTPASPKNIWWWLPPVIWPQEEISFFSTLTSIIRKGGHHFVLNAPWQSVFFKQREKYNLWAGPFCNIANPQAIGCLAARGFSGVIVSPELHGQDLRRLPKQSPLPLGVVISANWPLCVARTLAPETMTGIPFTSPKGEQAWVQKNGSTYWIYPNWKLDLTRYAEDLKSNGYSLLVNIEEPVPKKVTLKRRPGIWNWEKGLG